MNKLEELKIKIKPIFKALEVDGFNVEIVCDEKTIEINIDESNANCSDCLLPKTVLENIVYDNIKKLDFDTTPNVIIKYPAD